MLKLIVISTILAVSLAAPSRPAIEGNIAEVEDSEVPTIGVEQIATETQPPENASLTRNIVLSSRDNLVILTPRQLQSIQLQQLNSGSEIISSRQQIQLQPLVPSTTVLAASTLAGTRTVITPETIRIHEPTIAKIGELVQKIPSAVSHQSSTIVHKHAKVVTPIVAPAVRTQTHQILRAYSQPILYASASALTSPQLVQIIQD